LRTSKQSQVNLFDPNGILRKKRTRSNHAHATRSRLEEHATRSIGDLEVVRRVRSGDRRAFEEVYRANVGRVYAVSANPVRAAEWTQDTFVRAWEMLDSYRGESAFSTWLHRVAVNVALHALRTDRRWTQRFQRSDDLEAFERAGSSGADDDFDLEAAIAALPPRSRAVFVLHDVEGYPHAEIAAMMDIKTGTSKALLHRAHTQLKKALMR
jgi:RNA polymerase sigma-70 factor (ECF subfamily)